MKKALFSLLLIISLTSQAQNIKGKVCFEKDKSPVQFASVGLLQLPDSTMITGIITLTDGGYLLENVKPGEYFLKVSFVGYKSNGKQIIVQAANNEIAVDTIYLAEVTTSLNEVTVTAERIKGKEMVDRTVYAIPEVIAKSSNNGYDILKKIPQVNVDFQNNITLNGSSNFIIQVDGRQRDRDFLNKLLPSDIQSIEIISNPSGKYEGNIDGVINVILKKEARYGMNGNAGLNVKPFNKPTIQATGSLDYSMGKITFYVTGFSFLQKLNINTTDRSNFVMNDSTSIMSGKGALKVTSSSVNMHKTLVRPQRRCLERADAVAMRRQQHLRAGKRIGQRLRARAEIQRHDDAPGLGAARKDQHVVRHRDETKRTDTQRAVRAAQRDQRAIQRQDRRRVGVAAWRRCAPHGRRRAAATAAPRGEAGVAARRPTASACATGSRPRPGPARCCSHGSCTASGGIVDVGQADLVAVVHRRRAAQRQQQHRRDARLRRADAARRCAAGRDCRAPSSASRLAAAARLVVARSARRSRARVHGRLQQLEIERQMRAVAGRLP